MIDISSSLFYEDYFSSISLSKSFLPSIHDIGDFTNSMIQGTFSLLQFFNTKKSLIELTLTDSDGTNFHIFLKNSVITIEELRKECRECLMVEGTNTNQEADNFEWNLFYKNLDDDTIKYQLRNDKDLNKMLIYHQLRNAKNNIRIFAEVKMKNNGDSSAIELNDTFKKQKMKIEENDWQPQQQSTSSAASNWVEKFNSTKNSKNETDFDELRILNRDCGHENYRQKNDFVEFMSICSQNQAILDFRNIRISGNNFSEFEIRFGLPFYVGAVFLFVRSEGESRVLFNLDSQMNKWLLANMKKTKRNMMTNDGILYFNEEGKKEDEKIITQFCGTDSSWININPIKLYNLHIANINGIMLCTGYKLKNSNPIFFEKFGDTDHDSKSLTSILYGGNKQTALIHFDGLSAWQLLSLDKSVNQGAVWLYENCSGDEMDFLKYFRNPNYYTDEWPMVIEMVGIEEIKSDFKWLPNMYIFRNCKLVILKASAAGDFDKQPKIAISTISNFLISNLVNHTEEASLFGGIVRCRDSLQNVPFIHCIPSFHASHQSVASNLFNSLAKELFFLPGRILCIDLKLIMHPEFGISEYAEPLQLVCSLFKGFREATQKHPYLLFLKCPSTTVMPKFSLKCQNNLGETFEMKEFIDNAGKKKVKRKILLVERYFLETCKYCLEDSSPPISMNANIYIIGGEGENIDINNINTFVQSEGKWWESKNRGCKHLDRKCSGTNIRNVFRYYKENFTNNFIHLFLSLYIRFLWCIQWIIELIR